MKANFFAVVLSLFVVSLPVQSASTQPRVPVVKSDQKVVAKIDLNKADAKTLSKSIKGIGQKRAEAIVKYREEHGRFHSIEDLAQVKGFGQQFVKNHLSQLQEAFTTN